MKALIFVLASLSIAADAAPRSHAVVSEFKRLQPCPATGTRRGRCPGFVVDHITPLCAGGADQPSNMQWQTIKASKLKDRQERRLCRDLRQ